MNGGGEVNGGGDGGGLGGGDGDGGGAEKGDGGRSDTENGLVVVVPVTGMFRPESSVDRKSLPIVSSSSGSKNPVNSNATIGFSPSSLNSRRLLTWLSSRPPGVVGHFLAMHLLILSQ